MSYSFDTSTQFIKVIYTGTLDNLDIQGVLKDSLITAGEELKIINRIEDMRSLSGINIGFNEIIRFTENLRTIQLPRTVKSAILTSGTLQYGIARMFQSILEHPQMDIKIFSNEEEAHHWLSAGE
jgi:hypothetical protein